MNNLSIFVDESGDFGQYRPHSPYYIIAMVLHEQSKNLSSELTKLNIELENLGYKNPVVHTEPLIRREEDYLNMTPGNAEVFLQSYFTFYPDAMSGINLLSSTKKNIRIFSDWKNAWPGKFLHSSEGISHISKTSIK